MMLAIACFFKAQMSLHIAVYYLGACIAGCGWPRGAFCAFLRLK
jgi:hypothetical protein